MYRYILDYVVAYSMLSVLQSFSMLSLYVAYAVDNTYIH